MISSNLSKMKKYHGFLFVNPMKNPKLHCILNTFSSITRSDISTIYRSFSQLTLLAIQDFIAVIGDIMCFYV